MVSTRSATKQTHLEDFAAEGSTSQSKGRKSAPAKTTSKNYVQQGRTKKSKATAPSSTKSDVKRTKTSKQAPKRTDSAQSDSSSTITINRAPVLHLWAACVTHFLYPSLTWSTCLSAGSAISTICAVAKGRSIGTVSERHNSDEKQRKRAEAKRQQEEMDEIHVMHFNFKLKDGLALVGSEQKGKLAGEEGLKKKFGEDAYERVRKGLDEALGSWEESEEELDKQAFHFYEDFRPSVNSGQKGWGRKGELNVETIQSVVQKE